MAPPVGQIRPGRYLAFFVAVVAVLYALVFATGDHQAKPKLGIDLQGGTRVALTARTETGVKPSKDSLELSRQLIEARVNNTGVQGAEVVLDGDTIVITVPGENGEKAKDLGQTAQLRFRPVLQAAQATPQVQTNPSNPAEPPLPEVTGSAAPTTGAAPTSGAAATGAPTTGAPQGRPAPALEQQQTTTPAAPATGAPATEPASGAPAADDPCVQYATLLTNPSAAQGDLIAAGKKCRQNAKLGPSKGADGTDVPADQAAQQTALAVLDCTKPDPLVGNDDGKLPLATCGQDGQEKFILGPSFLEGTEIDNAAATRDAKGIGYVVTLDFKSGGSKTWAEYTAAHVNERAAFVLDTQVVSAPTIQGAINGQTQITGGQSGFKQGEAQHLAQVLKYGSLPLSFSSSEAETVSATLGLASLEAGLIAGGLGLLLVFIYCLVYYRLLGLQMILSLALSAVIVFAVLVLLGRWIGLSLDLPGIAGFIVAIGITADSFVIFFERLKDEVREGRTFRSAVPRAWVRARRTILSADAVSFLASAVLYIVAVGQVRGFAFTLGLSTVLDLVVVFLVTHPLVALASRSKLLTHPKYSGLGTVHRSIAAQRAAKVPASTGAKEV